MRSFISKLWSTLKNDGNNDSKPKAFDDDEVLSHTCHTPRVYQYRPNPDYNLFAIEADLEVQKHPFDRSAILFLITTSVAVADYCLLGRRDEISNTQPCLQLQPQSPEHLEICLRLRRCGAVKVSPRSWLRDTDCQIALEQHLNKTKYLFGWPPATNSTEPVWVYTIPRTSHLVHKDVVIHGGVEAHHGMDFLSNCTTMTEYCDKLESYNAVYYDDVQTSPEAQAQALVRRPRYLADVHLLACLSRAANSLTMKEAYERDRPEWTKSHRIPDRQVWSTTGADDVRLARLCIYELPQYFAKYVFISHLLNRYQPKYYE